MHNIAVLMSLYIKEELKYVSLAVESILNQTYKDFDFYIQCDGKIKDEVNIYLSKIKDERVRVYYRNENKGLAYSLNELLEIVRPMGYEFIARMDADDISNPDRFERQIAYLKNHTEIDCLGTWAVEIDADGNEYFHKRMPKTHNGCNKLFHKRDCLIHPTVMFRRSFFDKAGTYSSDTYFAEDTMLWAHGFATGCVFGNIGEYLYQFRINNAFFQRRRGWNHAKNIFILRHKVNKMLHYGIVADCWAICYAIAKMMPKSILNIIYKTAR